MNIEEFIKYYFPNLKDSDFTDRLKVFDHIYHGKQIPGWGRSIHDEGSK